MKIIVRILYGLVLIIVGLTGGILLGGTMFFIGGILHGLALAVIGGIIVGKGICVLENKKNNLF